MNKNNKNGLCFRCEHRARFFENGRAPRCECGDINSSKYGCYMYRPVSPVILKRDENDSRPQFGPAFISSRSYYDGIFETKNQIINIDNKIGLFSIPENHKIVKYSIIDKIKIWNEDRKEKRWRKRLDKIIKKERSNED